MSNVDGNNALAVLPSQEVEIALNRVRVLAQIVNSMRETDMKPGLDYGTIPGTGDKPTLLLPGMEKLMRALNAVPEYIERRVIVDYDRPLFHYEYECRLVDAVTGQALPGGRGLGLCTSMESSFRWRKGERVCPACGEAAIIKGKAEYGGGWLCWTKRGGCGAKFKDGDKDIEGQNTERVENPDIFDQVNSIMKRAKKRALADAVKGAAAVSEHYTVDLDDLYGGEIIEAQIVIDTPRTVDTDTGEIKAPEAATTPSPKSTPPKSANGSAAEPADSSGGSDDMPDELFQEAMKNTVLGTLLSMPPHRANTIRKVYREADPKPANVRDLVNMVTDHVKAKEAQS